MKPKKTLLIDGQWNLKRNFYKRKELIGVNGRLCGGTYGFLDSLKSIIGKTLPDRVIVFWDGFHAGKLRYDKYPFYKKSRQKDWENETRVLATEGIGDASDKEKFEIFRQKVEVQRYLEELFVRQIEEDYIEADDLIATYILGKKEDEEIYIFSRDGDFHQLVQPGVSMISPDHLEIITIDNFKEKIGYTYENALLIKCFEGDTSDDIPGINGIGINTLVDYYPQIIDEKYTFKRLVEEGYVIQEARENGKPKKKRLAKIDKIIDSKDALYRNAELMNLRRPFINQSGFDAVNQVRNLSLGSEDRSIETAIDMFAKDGYANIAGLSSLDYFFAPFYSLQAKEKEFEVGQN